MSKPLNQFIAEATNSNTKAGLQSQIANAFFRAANSKGGDTRSLLLLIAAITILNSGDDVHTLNIARRLATSGMSTNK
jgi:hypothetical protein